ncbi:hypothetical protein, partial [Pseudochelatococcus lubricantis]|uniref:hypothetical protein n=1 Tax=Pseudochelatococcus lubricantis TaxID=1538102 RepID=UPI001ABAC82A
SSQTWNNIYARKPLFGLTSALSPIHETWKNDTWCRFCPKGRAMTAAAHETPRPRSPQHIPGDE